MDPALQQMVSEGLPDDEVELIIKLKEAGKVPEGITIISQFGPIATVRMRRTNILPVYDSEEIISMKASRIFDSSRFDADTEADYHILETDLNRRQSDWPEGEGVVVGVIDWGIDFAHPNFRNPDGTSRLLYLWDQSQDKHPNSPQPYGYGRLYSQQEIDEALLTDAPYAHLKYHCGKSDTGIGAHGTHVSDIAAGNGRVGPSGIAPKAKLVFVHLAAKTRPGNTLGDSVRILEAIDFISKAAGPMPACINTSIGTHGGNHLGVSLVEQGIDAFLALHPNRVLCQSTGNYHLAKAHASGIVRPGRSCSIDFFVDQADTTPNELEIWYSGRDVFQIALSQPGLDEVFYSNLDENTPIRINSQLVGMIYHRSNEPNSGLNHIDIFLYKNAPPGAWEFTLQGEKVVDGRFHAWIERDNGCKQCQATFDPRHVDTATTIGIICNGYNTITVGAYDPHAPSFTLASFSSKGPTADGRVKPDLVAPGNKILAARSTPRSKSRGMQLLTRMSGTSMATPHVTGACALMLEQINKPVSIHTIRNLLLAATDEIEVPAYDKMRIGSGVLNIKRALELVKNHNETKDFGTRSENNKTRAASENKPVHYDFDEVFSNAEIGADTSSQQEHQSISLAFEKVLRPYEGAYIPAHKVFKAIQSSEGKIFQYLQQHFEVIAPPGTSAKISIKAGDLFLRHNPESGDTCYRGLNEANFNKIYTNCSLQQDKSMEVIPLVTIPVHLSDNVAVLRLKHRPASIS